MEEEAFESLLSSRLLKLLSTFSSEKAVICISSAIYLYFDLFFDINNLKEQWKIDNLYKVMWGSVLRMKELGVQKEDLFRSIFINQYMVLIILFMYFLFHQTQTFRWNSLFFISSY